MTLLDSEIQRIRYETGYNTMAAGAEPYVSVVAVFNEVVSTYITTAASTTSATAVTAATAPTPVTLTLTSATGFAAWERVIVDVDSRREAALVQSISGSDITLLLSKVHSGTYPVGIESGETIVREILRQLQAIGDKLGGSAVSAAGVKRVDEIEFFGTSSSGGGMSTVADNQSSLRTYWRNELASACGVTNLWNLKPTSGGAQSTEAY